MIMMFLLNFFRPKWKHSNPNVREKAIKKLAETERKDGASILINALSDSHESVREAAINSLSQMGYRVVDPLLQSLNSPDPSVRKGVINVLGTIDDLRIIEPLINILRDNDSGVRKTAINALSKIGGLQAVEPIIDALVDSESYVRKAAAYALRTLAEKVGDMNLKRLAAAYNRDMEKMLYNLIQSGDSRVVVPIGKVLKEGNWAFRPAAAEALGRLGNPLAIEPLIAAISDERGSVRKAAATALFSLYTSKKISDEQKAIIFQQKDVITEAYKCSGE